MDKYALVTGSSRGIGRAIAKALAESGFNIFINYRSNNVQAEKAAEEVRHFGVDAFVLQGDVSIEQDMGRVFAKINDIAGKLNLLVNNAALYQNNTIDETSVADFHRSLNVNLIGPVITTKYALALLKKAEKPQIINIASRLGKEKTKSRTAAYSASKAGLLKFTKCCALEFGEFGIRVNAICPGLTDTELTRAYYTDQKSWDDAAQLNPRRRVGRPDDVAKVTVFLASDDADYINGEAIGVHGGSVLV